MEDPYGAIPDSTSRQAETLMRGCVFPNDQGSFDPWGRASEFLGSHVWPSDRSTQRPRRYIRGLGFRSWVSALTSATVTDPPPPPPLPPPLGLAGRMGLQTTHGFVP